MKLFKKMAAAALAAILALSMVGCGAASTVDPNKQLILDMIKDSAAASPDSDIKNTSEMDKLAQDLLNEANAAASKEENAGKKVQELMSLAVQAKPESFKPTLGYMICCAESYQFKSGLLSESKKQDLVIQNMISHRVIVNRGIDMTTGRAEKGEIGVATGKIGGKSYTVVVIAGEPAADAE